VSPVDPGFRGWKLGCEGGFVYWSIKLGDMSSITVTTQAGIHHESHSHPYPTGEHAGLTTMVIVGVICGVILIRGIIKTFK